MKRARAAAADSPSPEDLLQRAMSARSATARARYAQRGLSVRPPLDRTTQSMLLRQLYLAYFEQQYFERALVVARQMLELDTLVDVCHQDVARAYLLLGETDEAVAQLRLAARRAPASRRSFHLWTLGSVLYLARRYEQAEQALRRAVRWSTTDRPLCVGHLALVQLARQQAVDHVDQIIEQLEAAPCGQGYGRFVLGMLCAEVGRWDDADRYLRSFIKRTELSRPALVLALSAELRMAHERLRCLVLQ